ANDVAKKLNEREIIAKVQLKSIINVMDAAYFYNERSDEIHQGIIGQIEIADHVIINKVDLISEEDKQKLIKKTNEYSPNAYHEETEHSNIDFERFFEHIHTDESADSKVSANSQKVVKYSNMTTLGLPVDASLKKEDVEHFFAVNANEIIRAKGFVPL